MGGGLGGHLSQQDRENGCGDSVEDAPCVRCGIKGSLNNIGYCQECVDALEFLVMSNWDLKHEIAILTSRLKYLTESRPDTVYESEIPKIRERIHLCEMELARRDALNPVTLLAFNRVVQKIRQRLPQHVRHRWQKVKSVSENTPLRKVKV